MSDSQKSIEQVADIVECEELGYAITSYLDSDAIADPKLAAMWGTARHLLNSIEEYLETGGMPGEDDPVSGFTIVRADDWVALYLAGTKIAEGHSLSERELLESLGIEGTVILTTDDSALGAYVVSKGLPENLTDLLAARNA